MNVEELELIEYVFDIHLGAVENQEKLMTEALRLNTLAMPYATDYKAVLEHIFNQVKTSSSFVNSGFIIKMPEYYHVSKEKCNVRI